MFVLGRREGWVGGYGNQAQAHNPRLQGTRNLHPRPFPLFGTFIRTRGRALNGYRRPRCGALPLERHEGPELPPGLRPGEFDPATIAGRSMPNGEDADIGIRSWMSRSIS